MVGVLINLWLMTQRALLPKGTMSFVYNYFWVLSTTIFEFFQILIRSVHHNFPRIRAHFRVWVPINYYNLSVDGNHNLCFARPGQKCYLKFCSYSTIYWSMSIPVSNFISLIDWYNTITSILQIVRNLYQFRIFQFWLSTSTSPGSSVGRASGF